jgi:endonuclease YncB( thermonuclease family)
MSRNAVLTVYNCSYVPPENDRMRLDGDTFRALATMRPVVPDAEAWVPKVRVVRINAPETGKPGAEEARTALIKWLMRGPFDLHCISRDKYGRMLAEAEDPKGQLLSQYMLDHSLAAPMSWAKATDLAPGSSGELLLAIAHADRV